MNLRKEQLSERQLQKVILGMFLAGLPFGVLTIYGLIREPSDWMAGALIPGVLIWGSWLLRFFFPEMPRIFRIIIWSVSSVWHALLMPLCILGMLVWFGWYFAIHCFVMLGLSLKLITEDRLKKQGLGESGRRRVLTSAPHTTGHTGP